MAFEKKKQTRFKKKICQFCANRELVINYKATNVLKNYISETGKIEPRRLTGTCAKHQRQIGREIKKAREMALVAYVTE